MALPPGVVRPYRMPLVPKGHCWRVLTPKWASEPVSGAGAAAHGGRWNRPGVEALYVSEPFAGPLDVTTAWKEFQQDLGPRIGTLAPYEIDFACAVDLTDPASLRALGIAAADLQCLWKDMVSRGLEPPTWRICDRLIAEDVHGVRVPSAANPGGVNFVMWRLDNSPGCRVTVVDPDSALPVDRASWPAVRGPSASP